MKRNAVKELYKWKESNDRKPLIMLGARLFKACPSH